jgi:hypothetical protein
VIILPDAGPLGMLSNPSGNLETTQCRRWLNRLLRANVFVFVPEIADYEVRRELLRLGRPDSVERLNEIIAAVGFLAINTAAMRRAAELWAIARQRGRPTAAPEALDADVILAAQAQILSEATGQRVVVATANLRHLAQFVDARRWQDIEV